MSQFGDEYFAKKVIVLNAENFTRVKFKYRVNKKMFNVRLVYSSLVVLIVVNLLMIGVTLLGGMN